MKIINILLLLLSFTNILIDILNITTSENKGIWIIFLFLFLLLFLVETIELLNSDQFTNCLTNKKENELSGGGKMLKDIENIIISRATDDEKLEALKQYEDDIKTAKDIINGKLTYCEECKDYYLTKSFFSEKESIPTEICTYRDPINSGGNEYIDGYADILYRVCPKGHKHVVDRKERRK
ncbi:MAG: hypothetical protein SOY42_07030 [Clostridium sp.]|nr:hypothetical protein [Clostridium sp.]